jgi:hypothetical protein
MKRRISLFDGGRTIHDLCDTRRDRPYAVARKQKAEILDLTLEEMALFHTQRQVVLP